MCTDENVYIVIPARSGSKGIPEKNLTYFNNETILTRCISKACQITDPQNVILTTNDYEISMVGKAHGVTVVQRENELAQDHTTLDPVVYAAISETKAKFDDIVITLQVTSPNWSVATLSNAISYLKNKNLDTLISGKEARHLSWRKTEFGCEPEYAERKNRQEMIPRYIETGAFLITRLQNITGNSRIGKRLGIYDLPESEAEDIDTVADYAQAKYHDQNQRVAINVIGKEDTGTGHIFNCIEIARRIPEKQIKFFVHPDDYIAAKLLKSKHYDVKVSGDIMKSIVDYKPATVIFDCLNTEIEDVTLLKEKGMRVISFEDFGSGSHYTDYTFNALYPRVLKKRNIYSGPEFFIIKNDIQMKTWAPQDQTDDVLVFFGGTDPMQHTEKFISEIEKLECSDIRFSILFGLGKKNKDLLRKRAENLVNVKTFDYVASVSQLIADHKVAITSAGRTMYELSVMRKPFVVAFQGEREKLHFREFKDNTDIPYFDTVTDQTISAVRELLSDDVRYRTLQSQLDTLKIGKSINEIIGVISS